MNKPMIPLIPLWPTRKDREEFKRLRQKVERMTGGTIKYNHKGFKGRGWYMRKTNELTFIGRNTLFSNHYLKNRFNL